MILVAASCYKSHNESTLFKYVTTANAMVIEYLWSMINDFSLLEENKSGVNPIRKEITIHRQ